jgi:hypothetical protein
MTTRALDYAAPEKRRMSPRAVIGVIAVIIALLVLLPIAWSVRNAVIERELRAESRRLLLFNAPQQTWPTMSHFVVTADGHLVLPDGRLGRLAQAPLPPRQPPGEEPLASLIEETLKHIHADVVGCTVLRTDADGTPVVRLVARSPRDVGMCGWVTQGDWVETRRAAMPVWRNVGLILSLRGDLPGDPQSTGYEAVSVAGW